MKQLLCFLCLGLSALMPFFSQAGTTSRHRAATSSVPETVIASFHAKYPEASVKKWYEVNNQYQAIYQLDKVKYASVFEKDGNWKTTDRKFALTAQLPKPVKQGFKNSGYEGCNIDGIREETSPARNVYIIHVDDGDYYDSDHHDVFTRDYLLYFSADGRLIKAQQKA